MKSLSSTTIKYVVLSALCGLASNIILIVIWNHISGVSLSILSMNCLPCAVSWGIAAITGKYVCKRLVWLPVITFLFAMMISSMPLVFAGCFSDASIKGWAYLYILGMSICSLPAFIIIQLLTPVIFKDKNKSH